MITLPARVPSSQLILSRIISTCCCISISSCAPSARARIHPAAFAVHSSPPENLPIRHHRHHRHAASAPQLCSTAMVFDKMAFGPKITIPGEHIFFQTEKSAAFVNLKPIVPGHVLVVPKRAVPRIHDLSEDESVDLWLSVTKVSAAIEKEYGATALNIAMQDGRDAGQSVPHVHFHILPRAPADFSNNDDIYDAIESFDADPATAAGVPEENKAPPNARSKLKVPRDEDRLVRTTEDMAREALHLRRLFSY